VTTVDYQQKISKKFSYFLGFENTFTNGFAQHQFIQVKSTTGTPSQTVTGFTTTTDSTGTKQLFNI
jgi:hypothetical protein